MCDIFRYRGKALSGNYWNFGNSIIYSTECEVSYIAEAKKDIDNINWEVVHSETVGRFINVCDEERMPIFENDIVHAQFLIHTLNSWGNSVDEEMSVVGVVEQIGSSFGITSEKGLFFFDSTDTDKELLSVRIIGNIFDDPGKQEDSFMRGKAENGSCIKPFRCRGKSLRFNKWLYGLYQEFPIGSGCDFMIAVAEKHLLSPVMAKYSQVFPASIGRSIGRRDRNKTEIFEGDILKFEFFSEKSNQLLLCVWNNTECRFDFQIIGDNNGSFLLPSDIDTHCIEIVGNRIDNPELLKE